jgi:hypothetical protein
VEGAGIATETAIAGHIWRARLAIGFVGASHSLYERLKTK